MDNVINIQPNNSYFHSERRENLPQSETVNEPQDTHTIYGTIKDIVSDRKFLHNLNLGMEAVQSVICTGADAVLESKLGGFIKTASSTISAASVPVMLYNGVKDMKKAVKTRDAVLGTDAGGTFALAANNAIVSGQHLTSLPSVAKVIGTKVAAALSHPMVSLAAKSLGLAYAGTELLTGGYRLAKGIKNDNKAAIFDGAIGLAKGVAAATLFTIGGPVTAVVLGAFNLTDIIVKGVRHFNKTLKNRAAIRQMAKLKEETAQKQVENSKDSVSILQAKQIVGQARNDVK